MTKRRKGQRNAPVSHSARRVSHLLKTDKDCPGQGDGPLAPGCPTKKQGGQLMEDSRAIEAIVPKTESDGPPGPSVKSLTPPLHPGWRVAVKGRRDVEYVASCEWNGMTWIATLQSGRQIPVSQITAVGKVNDRGRTIVAWYVRAHGISGNERETR